VVSQSIQQQYTDIVAQIGTPCYVYDRARIETNFARLQRAFGADALYYAVKANGNLHILRLLRELGAGFDVVSVGEMQRALMAGARPDQIVFAGVGKRDDELIAAIEAGVGYINVESAQELRVLSDIAHSRGRTQTVALRINPAVDPHTHQYLATGKGNSKFGVNVDEGLSLVAQRDQFPGVRINGVHTHIGSMLFDIETYVQTMEVLLDFVGESRAMGAPMSHVDMGGGFGVAYTPDQRDVPIEHIAELILPMARAADVQVQFEPGRFIIAESGVLLARVLFTKTNGDTHYAIVDAAMTDLIRPTLYGATHGVSVVGESRSSRVTYDMVGPVCESGDFLARRVTLPELQRGDLVAFHHAGAYAMSMSSNYNARPRAAEVMLEGDTWRVIRRRETLESLWAAEL
jgi:diaminopimelate decarboxylase